MDNRSIVIRASAACAALLAAALAGSGSGQRAEEAASTEASAGALACLNHPTIRRTRILDARNIVFFTRDEAIYRNYLPKECPGLGRNSLVNYTIMNKRQCAGDNFQILWQTNPGNYTPAFVCQLGAFVPITADELEDLTAMTAPDRERRSRRRSAREAVTTEQVELPPDAAAPAPAEATPTETAPAE